MYKTDDMTGPVSLRRPLMRMPLWRSDMVAMEL